VLGVLGVLGAVAAAVGLLFVPEQPLIRMAVHAASPIQ
jgi:hypothetical protein